MSVQTPLKSSEHHSTVSDNNIYLSIYLASAFIAVPSSQLIATSPEECSLCRPPSWNLLTGQSFQSFTRCDTVLTSPHPHLSEDARPHLCRFAAQRLWPLRFSKLLHYRRKKLEKMTELTRRKLRECWFSKLPKKIFVDKKVAENSRRSYKKLRKILRSFENRTAGLHIVTVQVLKQLHTVSLYARPRGVVAMAVSFIIVVVSHCRYQIAAKEEPQRPQQTPLPR